MQRITKREAFKRFCDRQNLYLCPCKLVPDGPFSNACLVSSTEWMERAEGYKTDPTLWSGTIEKTAWDLMYNNWAFYNTCYEAGYYAHYYI